MEDKCIHCNFKVKTKGQIVNNIKYSCPRVLVVIGNRCTDVYLCSYNTKTKKFIKP